MTGRTLSLAPDEVEHVIRVGLRILGTIKKQRRGWAAYDAAGVGLGCFLDEHQAGLAVLYAFSEKMAGE